MTEATASSVWLVLWADDSDYDNVEGVQYQFPARIPNGRQISAGDAIVTARSAAASTAGQRVFGVGRIGSVRPSKSDRRSALFDRYCGFDDPATFDELGGDPRSNKTNSINRVDNAFLAAALARAGVSSVDALPAVEEGGEDADLSTPSAVELRARLFQAVIDDLLGPADGPEEEIAGPSVRDRYVVGQLAPRGTNVDPEEVDDLPGEADGGGEEGKGDVETPQATTLVPASLGLTFVVEGGVQELVVEASWGHYERTHSEILETEAGNPQMVWKRRPISGHVTIALNPGAIERQGPSEEHPMVFVEGGVRELAGGRRVVTLFLVNGQVEPDETKDEAWLFQPSLRVRARDGAAVFRRRAAEDPIGGDELDAEERALLALQYRDHVEFAVGHGTGVHAEKDPGDPERATAVATRIVPWFDVPATETPTAEEVPALVGLELDMKMLSTLETPQLVKSLGVLGTAYEAWIGERVEEAGSDPRLASHRAAARIAIERCREALRRLREGIETLAGDEQAADAFRFANDVMYLQRIHSEYALRRRRGEEASLSDLDVPENRSWRPFQLAFLLVALPGLTDPRHRDRSDETMAVVDLLWFPTGGGKTEAYLGIAAYTMGLRRLQGTLGDLDGARGVTVLMRYTLRLLTIQQFQRSTTLMCAMEVVRRRAIEAGDPKWGAEPFRIGLWVGARATPQTTEESRRVIKNAHKDSYARTGSGTPFQLGHCPWCGSKLELGRDVVVEDVVDRTISYCSDKLGKCPFSKKQAPGEGIPAVVVDQEIYRLLPTLLIGTVDKFAQLPWNGALQQLFGRVSRFCPRHGFLHSDEDDTGKHTKSGSHPATSLEHVRRLRPPDLVIQDELHLISGPLGTMVGLYETAIDGLCSWKLEEAPVRPKVIASTATIRRARDQVHGLYCRRVDVFPPRGLSAEDNFFARQRDTKDVPGRRYFGICAPGRSRPSVLIRVYVALLAAGQHLYGRYGAAADPWMTLVGYFNSLRELGGMRRLVEDDVSTRLFRIGRAEDLARPGLAARTLSAPEELTSRKASAEIPTILDWLEEAFDPDAPEDRRRPIDAVLATNMLSVGVDVQRLGLMAVAGQPKNTAEYIQATSRVGRRHPGLISTVLNWSRPRDLSHYERFEHYHATFYQQVEALSVTPFAARALDRGLTAQLVSLLRLEQPELTPNTGAAALDRDAAYVRPTVVQIAGRAWNVSGEAETKDLVEETLAERLDQWAHEVEVPGRTLVYRATKDAVPLLVQPRTEDWTPFTLLNSLRDVEPNVSLLHFDPKASDEPAWEPPEEKEENS